MTRAPFGVRPEPPGPGQESVWDYPRPPAVRPTVALIEVSFGGAVVARTTRALLVLETSHPPGYYLPEDDWLTGSLRPAPGQSFCEFKGAASYLSVVVEDAIAESAAWTYRRPMPGFELLRGHIAVYPDRMDSCTVDGEVVRAQDGGFYGGWITSAVVGPFKGVPGSRGW